MKFVGPWTVHDVHWLAEKNRKVKLCGYCSCTVQLTVAAKFDFSIFFQPISAHRALFMDPQISLFNNFFIKNGSHGTIYTFKIYFATVFFSFQFQFSVFSCIQTDPKSCNHSIPTFTNKHTLSKPKPRLYVLIMVCQHNT